MIASIRRWMRHSYPSGAAGAGLLLMRLFLGFAFVLHGSGKLAHPAEFAVEFGLPVWMAFAALATQLACGVLLLVGLFVPLAGLGIAGTMAPAAFFLIRRGEPFINPEGHSWENAAFYLMAGTALALMGGGAYSLDAYLAHRGRKPSEKAGLIPFFCLLLALSGQAVGQTPGAAPIPANAARQRPRLPSEESLARLLAGNRRFTSNRLRMSDVSRRQRDDLAKRGQHPFAVILSCADSRVPPELVFDQGLGDLFVVRVAGNIVDDAVIGSIEYAAEHLGARLVLVLGHESCGAVAAAIHNQREAHLAVLVDAIRPAVESVTPPRPLLPDEWTALVVKANVVRVRDQLRASPPVLRRLHEQDEVRFVGGYYNFASGTVDLLP